MSHKDSTIA